MARGQFVKSYSSAPRSAWRREGICIRAWEEFTLAGTAATNGPWISQPTPKWMPAPRNQRTLDTASGALATMGPLVATSTHLSRSRDVSLQIGFKYKKAEHILCSAF